MESRLTVILVCSVYAVMFVAAIRMEWELGGKPAFSQTSSARRLAPQIFEQISKKSFSQALIRSYTRNVMGEALRASPMLGHHPRSGPAPPVSIQSGEARSARCALW